MRASHRLVLPSRRQWSQCFSVFLGHLGLSGILRSLTVNLILTLVLIPILALILTLAPTPTHTLTSTLTLSLSPVHLLEQGSGVCKTIKNKKNKNQIFKTPSNIFLLNILNKKKTYLPVFTQAIALINVDDCYLYCTSHPKY